MGLGVGACVDEWKILYSDGRYISAIAVFTNLILMP